MNEEANKTDKLSQNDLDRFAKLLDDRLVPINNKMATKDDLKKLEETMATKQHLDETVETIMEGINTVIEKLATKERVDKLEVWAHKVSEKVGVKLDI